MKSTNSSRTAGPGGRALFPVIALAAMWLAGCAGPSGYPAGGPQAPAAEASAMPWDGSSGVAESARERRPDAKPPGKAAEERPGLATGFGEPLTSPWHRESFVRASTKPAGTAAIYYNDKKGIDAMTGYRARTGGTRKVAGEVLEWGIKGSFGYLPTFTDGYRMGGAARTFVVGKQDSNYSIVLKNRCKSRLEVVLSVDGLDVIDGKPASFSKRGHVIRAGEALEVKGWRTSPDTVARFTFSSVAGSYSNLRHGAHRHVGVIGLAVFTEKGVDPWTWMPGEVNDRLTANPFAQAP